MDYHKTQLAFTERKEYRLLPPAIKGNHGVLLHYCARLENSGVIAGSYTWSDREWLMETNGQLRKKDVAAVVAANLAFWNSDDSLTIQGYDVIGQQECQHNRERNREWRKQQREHARKDKRARSEDEPSTLEDDGEHVGEDEKAGSATAREQHAQQLPVQSSPVHTSPGGGERARSQEPPPPKTGLEVLQAAGVTINRDLPGFTELVQGMTTAEVEDMLTEYDGIPYWPSDLRPAKTAWQRRAGEAKTRETDRIQDQRRERQRAQEAETQRTMQQSNAEALARAKAVLAAIETDQSLLDGISPRAHELVSKIQVNTLAGKPAPIWLGQLFAEAPALANASRLQARAAS